MIERQPNRPTPVPEQQQAPAEGGKGSPSLPLTTHERAKPPPESALSRAVERTRELYERNGWVFLPFGEAGQGNASSANTVDAVSPDAGLKDNPPLKKRRSLAFAGP